MAVERCCVALIRKADLMIRAREAVVELKDLRLRINRTSMIDLHSYSELLDRLSDACKLAWAQLELVTKLELLELLFERREQLLKNRAQLCERKRQRRQAS